MDINTDLAREELVFTNFANSQLVLCAIIYFILPFEVAGFIEFMCNEQKRANVTQRYLRFGLFAGEITGTILVSLVLSLALYREFDEELCTAVSIITFLMYVMCLCISYMFLLQKAKLVSRFDQAKPFYQKMFRAVEMSMLLMFGGGAIGGGLTRGRLTNGGHCAEIVPSPMIWLMLVTNAFTVIALLYLFLQPLKRMAETPAVGSNTEILAVFRRNAIISSTAVLGTFILGTVYGVLVILGESTGIDEYYTIGLQVMVWDIVILCVASRLTTNMWLPSYMVHVLRIGNKSQVSEVTTSVNGNNHTSNNHNNSYRASMGHFERSRSITPTGVQQVSIPAMGPLVTIGDIKE